ncbi:MAG: lipoyl synthase [Spirochaetes bacterium GWB1_59_5]|nr:MAG: lipoyl synthase [Spirochaetes bacterium GWB1_59_5]
MTGASSARLPERKPAWLRVAVPSGERWRSMSALIARRGLHTVCDEAACPNKAECWGCGTATFMVLGDVCTRGCRFCAVATAKAGTPPRQEEPEELAKAVAELKLKYAVITSVDRDDLADRGAGHFAACVTAIKSTVPGVKVEVLIPDFFGAELDALVLAAPDVIAHNVETVRRLQSVRDARASFDLSLRTLREVKERSSAMTKTSLMLGLGETEAELIEAMDELRAVGCDMLVMGQYLRPTTIQVPVAEYLSPERFDHYAALARERGFLSVVSAPLARTSWHAMEGSEAAVSSAETAAIVASDERANKGVL